MVRLFVCTVALIQIALPKYFTIFLNSRRYIKYSKLPLTFLNKKGLNPFLSLTLSSNNRIISAQVQQTESLFVTAVPIYFQNFVHKCDVFIIKQILDRVKIGIAFFGSLLYILQLVHICILVTAYATITLNYYYIQPQKFWTNSS